MKNICLIIEYDGSAFSGFQKQPGKVTVQGELERTIELITGSYIPVFGAGRTDTGVSAEKMYINFQASTNIPAERFVKAINRIVDRAITVKESFYVSSDFNARHSAVSRTYRYRVLNTKVRSSLRRNFVCNYPYELDEKIMNDLWLMFQGKHDFSSFCKTGSDRKYPYCDVFSTSMIKVYDEIHFFITAQSFLRSMVRLLIGSVLLAGQGKISKEIVWQALKGKIENPPKFVAPAEGLCLIDVCYPPDFFGKNSS